MKKQYVIMLGGILSVSIFLSSCRDKVNRGALKFDSVELNETAHLFGDTAKPACNLTVKYTYVSESSDKALMDSLNMFLTSATLGEKFIGTSPEEAIKYYAEDYTDGYCTDLEPMYIEDLNNKENEGTNIGSWYSYYRNIESEALFYEGDLLIYKIFYNEYTGGAHGSYMTTYLNMDLKNVRPLSLSDLFVGEYEEALTDLLWNQLTMQVKVTGREELEEMGYGLTGDLLPTENFYLDKEGITFHYNVYDFTPYVMGETEIKLPYEMISHLLGSHPVISQLKN